MQPQRLAGALLRETLQPPAQLTQPWAHQLQPQLHGRLASFLLVGGSHRGSLLIAEQGKVVGSWDVTLRVFSRCPHVHHWSAWLQKPLDRFPDELRPFDH